MLTNEIIKTISKEVKNKVLELPINSEFRLIEFLDVYELENRDVIEISIGLISELINTGICVEKHTKMKIESLPMNIFLLKIK